MNATVTVDTSKLAAALTKMIAKAGITLARETTKYASVIRARWLTGPTSNAAVGVRSGVLRASCKPQVVVQDATGVSGGIQFGGPYARVHIGPRGQVTTIVPKTAQYLAIPFPAFEWSQPSQSGGSVAVGYAGVLTKAGVGKGTARGGPWGNTFVRKSKAGNLILFGQMEYQKGKKVGQTYGDLVPLFILKKSVMVPARVHPEDIIAYIKPELIAAFRRAKLTEGD